MQAKRIFSLLVVVVLTILCGVMSVGAQDNAVNFEYAVEVSASTAIVEEPCLTLKPGESIDVSVTVTANPGIKMMKFAVVFDSAAIAPVLDADKNITFTSGKMFGTAEESVYVDSKDANKIWYVVDATSAGSDITATGTVITLHFTVVDGYHGTSGITLASYEKNVGGGTIPGHEFDSITAKDASTADYNKASFSTHSYGDPVEVTATCETPGTKTYTCTVEGCTSNTLVIETAPATEHTEVVDEAKAPTCTETGLTEGKHCSVCEKVFVAQEVVPVLAHNEVVDAAKAPTCTETGLTEGKHCADCNAVIVAQETVAALGHTVVVEEAVEPTYSATGRTEGKYCSVCDEVLVPQEVIPEKSSTWIWITVIAAIVVLGAGGFCLYWFVFRPKED